MSNITPGQLTEVVELLDKALNESYQLIIHSEPLFGNIPFVSTLKQKIYNNISEAKMKLEEMVVNSMEEIEV